MHIIGTAGRGQERVAQWEETGVTTLLLSLPPPDEVRAIAELLPTSARAVGDRFVLMLALFRNPPAWISGLLLVDDPVRKGLVMAAKKASAKKSSAKKAAKKVPAKKAAKKAAAKKYPREEDGSHQEEGSRYSDQADQKGRGEEGGQEGS